jgi:F0F1-type ATP synthase epsilon subunit
MNGHAPLLAALADAPLRIKTGEDETVLVCFGGTLRVGENGTVEITVQDAVRMEEIDIGEVNRRLSSPEMTDGREKERLSLLKRIKEEYG